MPGGRPIKKGVDYFPLDVFIDDKLELIESEHGIQGFGVVIKLYQKIYAGNYYIIWDKKSLLVFSNRVNVDINSINAIINSCLEWNIFNNDMYKRYNVLTSTGIQKRFFEIVKKRKIVEICEDFLLIELDVNAYNNLVYVSSKSQRKGKVKESIEEKDLPESDLSGDEKIEEIYITAKKRKLQGKRLESFILFWNAFNYKKDKANASDSWLNIPQLTDKLVNDICKAAESQALKRDDIKRGGMTPIYAQGWLTGKRWEDEDEESESFSDYCKRMREKDK